MKKLTAILTLLLVLSMVFCLAACGDDTGSTEPESTTTEPSTTPSEPKTEPTEPSTEPTDPPVEFTHTIKVVDENGNGVAGIYVQYCNDEMCFVPVATDEDGVAGFVLNGEITKAQYNDMAGYTLVGDNVVYLEDGQTEVVFTVTRNA